MREFLNRPYRSYKVRKERVAKAKEYKARVQKSLKNSARKVAPIVVPPEILELAEVHDAGVSDSDS